MKKYVDRLLREWNLHGKIIIGVYFDNTLTPYPTFDNQEDIDRTIKVLKDCQNVGCYIVIHTCSHEDRYDEIKKYCESIGIKVDSINVTPINVPWGDTVKPYCNHFLDDRGALPAALDILEEAMYKQRAFNYSQVRRDEIG